MELLHCLVMKSRRPLQKEPNSIKLMKGEQNADDPIMNYWSGYGWR